MICQSSSRWIIFKSQSNPLNVWILPGIRLPLRECTHHWPWSVLRNEPQALRTWFGLETEQLRSWNRGLKSFFFLKIVSLCPASHWGLQGYPQRLSGFSILPHHVAILFYQISKTLKILNPTALRWRIVPIGVKAHLENPKHYLLGVIFGPSLSHSTLAHSPVSLLSGEKLMVLMKP